MDNPPPPISRPAKALTAPSCMGGIAGDTPGCGMVFVPAYGLAAARMIIPRASVYETESRKP